MEYIAAIAITAAIYISYRVGNKHGWEGAVEQMASRSVDSILKNLEADGIIDLIPNEEGEIEIFARCDG